MEDQIDDQQVDQITHHHFRLASCIHSPITMLCSWLPTNCQRFLAWGWDRRLLGPWGSCLGEEYMCVHAVSQGDHVAGMLAVAVASSRTLEVLDLESTGLTNQSAQVRHLHVWGRPRCLWT